MSKPKYLKQDKQILIRNSILLVTLAMFLRANEHLGLDISKESIEDKDFIDMELIRLYKWLNKISKTFSNKKTQDFANKRLKKVFNGGERNADVLVSGLLLFYYYLDLGVYKGSIIPPFKKEDIEKVIKSFNFITAATIKFAEECIIALDPEVEGRLKLKYVFGTHRFKEYLDGNAKDDKGKV